MLARLALGPIAGLALVGCGPEIELGPQRAECENLNPIHCLLPWPTMKMLVDDASTPTGFRLEIPSSALPRDKEGVPPSPEGWTGFDGVSPATAILTAYSRELREDDLASEERIADSLTPQSPTVILDAETGERVAHFAELDHRQGAIAGARSLYLRPAARFRENHRYLVATHDLAHADGSPVEPAEYFRALRDGLSTDLDELEARRPAYEEIFSKLEAAGVPRASLIEAFEFHTASLERTRGDLARMREDALAFLADHAAELHCTVDESLDAPDDRTWRRVRGHFTVPLYLESDQPGARATRDETGEVVRHGLAEAPFEAAISRSAYQAFTSSGARARGLIFGHGVFGGADRLGGSDPKKALDRLAMIGVATDFWGLSRADVGTMSGMMGDYGRARAAGERMMQGALNFMVLAWAFRRGPCSALPELSIGGAPMLETSSRFHYYGISQGGALGPTIVSLSEDIERVALQLGGADYALLMSRSTQFLPFETLLELSYPDRRDRDWLMVSTSSPFGRADPATFASAVRGALLPGATAKPVLLQAARWDAEVPNVSSDLDARSMALPVLRGSVREPFGLEVEDAPLGSAYITYQVPGVDPLPVGLFTVGENRAHQDLTDLDSVQRQLDTFLREGSVIDVCDGPCDPD